MAMSSGTASAPWKLWWKPLLDILGMVRDVLAIVRGQLSRLEQQAAYSRRLKREVARRTDALESRNRDLAELNRKLQEVSLTDSLTGLWNRRYLANEIPKDLALIRRAQIERQKTRFEERSGPDPNLLFLMMDLDGLKEVNDTCGHQAGDRVIVQMKELLVGVCRQSDTLIRWGGDEFLLLGRQTDRDAAARLAERIRLAVDGHRFDLGDGDIMRLSCSIGFTLFPFITTPTELFSWEQVLDLADRALYRAKQAGRNRWVGVLSAAGADPAVVMKHKDDDLTQLAQAGLVELRSGGATPSRPVETDRASPDTPYSQLVERVG
jgi:diguanylate cyclase (GGDEF)-like protein|tara:strand:- start:4944 stop:5909 length:966 start_codon:yes stop_codon:yes gene_type:complete